MSEVNNTQCVACHEELDEHSVELRIAGIGPLCSSCAQEYETALCGD
jgi:hypothetical protein